MTPHGSSAQSIALARALGRNPEARASLIAAIEDLGKPAAYSFQEGDRRAHLAALVADIIRQTVEREVA